MWLDRKLGARKGKTSSFRRTVTALALGAALACPAVLAGGDGSATAATSTGLTGLSLNSYAGASLAIQQIDSALSQINSTNAALGAYQNRFQSAVANLQSTSQNLTAARSTVEDADFAAETANETRASVLQQAGVAVLGQANSQPQQILSLLQHL